MPRNNSNSKPNTRISAQPRLHQRANEIQAYGTVNHLLALELEEPVPIELEPLPVVPELPMVLELPDPVVELVPMELPELPLPVVPLDTPGLAAPGLAVPPLV